MTSMVSSMALGQCSADAKKRVLACNVIADVEKIMKEFVG